MFLSHYSGDAQIDPVSIDNNNDICSTPVSATNKSVVNSTDVSFGLGIFLCYCRHLCNENDLVIEKMYFCFLKAPTCQYRSHPVPWIIKVLTNCSIIMCF